MIRSRRVVLLVCSLVALLGAFLWRASQRWPQRVKLASGPILLIQNTPDGGFYAVSQDAKTNSATLWKLNANLSVASSRSWKHPVRGAALTTDGKILALEETDNGWQSVVRFYDTRDGHWMKTPEIVGAVGMAFSPDGRYFVFSSSDPYDYGHNWTVFRRQGDTLILEDRIKPNVSVGQFAFSRGSKTLAVGGTGGDLAVMDFPSLKPRAVWRDLHDDGGGNAVGGVALAPDGKHLLSSNPANFALWEWNAVSYAKRRQGPTPLMTNGATPANPTSLLDYSPDGTKWVLDGAQVGNASTLKTERTLPHKSPNTAQVFAPDGDLLVGDAGGTITRWKLK